MSHLGCRLAKGAVRGQNQLPSETGVRDIKPRASRPRRCAPEMRLPPQCSRLPPPLHHRCMRPRPGPVARPSPSRNLEDGETRTLWKGYDMILTPPVDEMGAILYTITRYCRLLQASHSRVIPTCQGVRVETVLWCHLSSALAWHCVAVCPHETPCTRREVWRLALNGALGQWLLLLCAKVRIGTQDDDSS